eukprot:TRINITY_DN24031_c0_g1_i1.p1 TRINITY_DN24031_c0_g1~~TRINITY_DN24031_c0_g1_i1.p1  ORF type:complete len:348 (-),score=44.85 TRINITY_DN24031_c0_g1_i1:50-1024(-)
MPGVADAAAATSRSLSRMLAGTGAPILRNETKREESSGGSSMDDAFPLYLCMLVLGTLLGCAVAVAVLAYYSNAVCNNESGEEDETHPIQKRTRKVALVDNGVEAPVAAHAAGRMQSVSGADQVAASPAAPMALLVKQPHVYIPRAHVPLEQYSPVQQHVNWPPPQSPQSAGMKPVVSQGTQSAGSLELVRQLPSRPSVTVTSRSPTMTSDMTRTFPASDIGATFTRSNSTYIVPGTWSSGTTTTTTKSGGSANAPAGGSGVYQIGGGSAKYSPGVRRSFSGALVAPSTGKGGSAKYPPGYTPNVKTVWQSPPQVDLAPGQSWG